MKTAIVITAAMLMAGCSAESETRYGLFQMKDYCRDLAGRSEFLVVDDRVESFTCHLAVPAKWKPSE